MARTGAHPTQRDDERRRALEALPGLAARRGRAGRAAGLAVAAALAVGACSGVASPAEDDAADEVTTTTEEPTTDETTATTEAPATTAPPTTEAPATTAPPTTAAPATTVPPTVPPTTAPPTTLPPDPAADGTLELGESGDQVATLQGRLTDLGYWLGDADGNYGQLTRQAVMAFQKAEGLGRDGTAGPITQQRLATAGRPTPRDPNGDHIEIDLERQVLFVVSGGQVRWAFNTSTGNNEAYTSSTGGTAVAATPPGTFTIDREIDGVREAPLGTLYRPKYFNGGIAVHGSGSIPAQPASHGCARLTNAAMDLLWSSGAASIGTTVLVY
jgi:peptidoglycan hydrolase-like protein with peptidoglycan-binding domain